MRRPDGRRRAPFREATPREVPDGPSVPLRRLRIRFSGEPGPAQTWIEVLRGWISGNDDGRGTICAKILNHQIQLHSLEYLRRQAKTDAKRERCANGFNWKPSGLG